jgi:hypothetical protein
MSSKTDEIFYRTVRVLDALAKRLDPFVPGGMDYNKINVWLMYVAFASVGLNIVLIVLLLW